jgi:hypothetical protein
VPFQINIESIGEKVHESALYHAGADLFGDLAYLIAIMEGLPVIRW